MPHPHSPLDSDDEVCDISHGPRMVFDACCHRRAARLRQPASTMVVMSDEPTQKTRPKKGEPVEIPVPSKDQVMTDFEKIATAPVKDEDESDD